MAWLDKPIDWNDLTSKEKLRSVEERMHGIYRWEERKKFRERWASPEQMEDEYGTEITEYIVGAFQKIKAEYLEVRDYALSIKQSENAKILEKIIQDDTERILLGEDNDK